MADNEKSFGENLTADEIIEEYNAEIVPAEQAEAASEDLTEEVKFVSPEEDLKQRAAVYAKENSEKAQKKKKANLVYDLIIALCIIVFCTSAFFLVRWLWQNQKNKVVVDNAHSIADISETEKVETEVGKVLAGMEGDEGEEGYSYLDLNMDELSNINSDTVGWLRVNGTMVDYPVVQCGDNEYYLTHDFEGNYTDAACPFLDYRNNAYSITSNRNFIIYGHARKDRSIFGSLDFCRQSWWQNNDSFQLIRYTSHNEQTVWRVFSVYTLKIDDYYYIETEFENDKAFGKFIDDIQDLSERDFGVSVGADDTILTLSTCAYNGDDRLVVHAKLVQVDSYNNEAIGDSVNE